MPLRASVRAGLITTAALSLALSAAAPAFADDVLPVLGDPCTTETVLPDGLTCTDGFVGLTPAPSQTPAPDPGTSADPTSGSPSTDPTPAPEPATSGNPQPGLPVTVPPIGTVDPPPGLPTAGGTTTGPSTPSAGGTTGDQTGTSSTGAAAGGTPAGSSASGNTPGGLQAAAAGTDPARTSLLAAATVSTLASGDVPSLAALRSLPTIPLGGSQALSSYTPSPLVADLPVATAIASVQAPLLAAGSDAASGGGFTLAGLSGKALPGLLVVLATALVAAVGAGNLRIWQERFPLRRR
jgi:hypothetical protein